MKPTWSRIGRLILIGIPIGIMVGLAAYVYASKSDGFVAARDTLTASELLAPRVGEIREVSVLPFRPFSEHISGDDRVVRLSIRVLGSAGEVDVKVIVTRMHGRWSLTQCRILGTSEPCGVAVGP